MSENNEKAKPPFEPLNAIGVFLIVFGAFVAAAALMPMEPGEKIIDVACGAVIVLCGAVALYFGRRKPGAEPGAEDAE